MASTETLKNADCCFICGECTPKLLNVDHRQPRSLIFRPKFESSEIQIPPGATLRSLHPLHRMVEDDSNQYKICLEHHNDLDKQKIRYYLGMWRFDNKQNTKNMAEYLESINRGEPYLLQRWLAKRYPWSPHPFYHFIQKGMITVSNQLFEDGVRKMVQHLTIATDQNQIPYIFSKELVDKYEKAAAFVRQFSVEVDLMPIPQLKTVIDFGKKTQLQKTA